MSITRTLIVYFDQIYCNRHLEKKLLLIPVTVSNSLSSSHTD